MAEDEVRGSYLTTAKQISDMMRPALGTREGAAFLLHGMTAVLNGEASDLVTMDDEDAAEQLTYLMADVLDTIEWLEGDGKDA